VSAAVVAAVDPAQLDRGIDGYQWLLWRERRFTASAQRGIESDNCTAQRFPTRSHPRT
jgi:hypothetical protein